MNICSFVVHMIFHWFYKSWFFADSLLQLSRLVPCVWYINTTLPRLPSNQPTCDTKCHAYRLKVAYLSYWGSRSDKTKGSAMGLPNMTWQRNKYYDFQQFFGFWKEFHVFFFQTSCPVSLMVHSIFSVSWCLMFGAPTTFHSQSPIPTRHCWASVMGWETKAQPQEDLNLPSGGDQFLSELCFFWGGCFFCWEGGRGMGNN